MVMQAFRREAAPCSPHAALSNILYLKKHSSYENAHASGKMQLSQNKPTAESLYRERISARHATGLRNKY